VKITRAELAAKQAHSARLALRHVDADQHRAVHAHKGHQMARRVRHGNVLRNLEVRRLLDGRSEHRLRLRRRDHGRGKGRGGFRRRGGRGGRLGRRRARSRGRGGGRWGRGRVWRGGHVGHGGGLRDGGRGVGQIEVGREGRGCGWLLR
jgi:hypothetical protein